MSDALKAIIVGVLLFFAISFAAEARSSFFHQNTVKGFVDRGFIQYDGKIYRVVPAEVK